MAEKIKCPLLNAAEQYPKALALISDDLSLDYSQSNNLAATTSAHLKNLPIKPGDRIVCLLENRIEYPILFMAILRLGAIPCTLSTRLPPHAIEEQIHMIHGKFLISSKQTFPTDADINHKVHYIEDLIHLKEQRAHHSEDIFFTTDTHGSILFTSGSTHAPKPVLLSVGNHYNNAKGSQDNIPIRPGDRWLLSLPFYHVAGQGLFFRCLFGGGAMVFPRHMKHITAAIKKHQVTHVSLVPTQLYRLLQSESYRECLNTLKVVLVGGSPCPEPLLQEAYAKDLPIYKTYGLTETASQVAATQKDDTILQLTSSGTCLSHCEIRIASNGEILVKGTTLCKGYIEEENYYVPVDKHGWFHTGDIGYFQNMNGKKYLFVTGRHDNMFISGGENIQPEEVEKALEHIDGVRQACVVPVPHTEFGYRPAAFVLLKENVPLDTAALQKQLRADLPGYKIPDYYFPWPNDLVTWDAKPHRQVFMQRAVTLLSFSNMRSS